MNNKHTPGPWRVGDAGATVFGPPNGAPCPKTICTLTHSIVPTGSKRADARLIAAAPDLLEALQNIEAWTATPGECTLDVVRACVRRAIAKVQS
jgi:hypothetical protein